MVTDWRETNLLSSRFLEGFIAELDGGSLSAPSLFTYFRDVFRLQPKQKAPAETDVSRALTRQGIEVWEFDHWDGFEDSIWAERDETANEIAERRRLRDTFTHDRQVRAEAEALLTVRYLRNEKFHYPGRETNNAFFISNTRAIDELADVKAPITMRPEAVLHLLTTLRPVDVRELAFLTDELLSELDQRGFSVVDRQRLMHVFGPLINASREDLQEVLARHRELLAEKYGEASTHAYAEVDPLDAPAALLMAQTQRAAMLEVELNRSKGREANLAKEARLTEQERSELEKLRVDEKLKRGLGRSRKRSAESRKTTKKKRKRRR